MVNSRTFAACWLFLKRNILLPQFHCGGNTEGEGGKVSPLTACVGMSKQVGFLLYETSDIASLSFLSVIKLDQCDPLLEKHLQHARENQSSVSYLSPEIQNEYIHLLSSTVRNQLFSEITKTSTTVSYLTQHPI